MLSIIKSQHFLGPEGANHVYHRFQATSWGVRGASLNGGFVNPLTPCCTGVPTQKSQFLPVDLHRNCNQRNNLKCPHCRVLRGVPRTTNLDTKSIDIHTGNIVGKKTNVDIVEICIIIDNYKLGCTMKLLKVEENVNFG